jgi:antitoxin component YwqK of YwqJK toxin-antitoxin module
MDQLFLNYRDDKKNGLYKEWYKNGQLKYQVEYKDDKKEGWIMV